jgi:tetratricopeptide (TPR) repeat protein
VSARPPPAAGIPARPLQPAQAQRLGQAFGLLQAGRVAEAEQLARGVGGESPGSPDVLHMLALCRKAAGDLAGSASLFADAHARAPGDVNLACNYANLLCRLSRFTEAVTLYRRALSAAPNHADGWLNLGLALIEAGQAAEACAAIERALAIRPNAAGWMALGSARRARSDFEGAAEASERATALEPRLGAAWINLGVVRRLLGDPATALECYQRARSVGFSGPQLDDAEASARLDLGEPEQALALARRLTATAPDHVAGHVLVAHVLWEHGARLAPGEDPVAAFQAAVDAQPGHVPLRRELIRFLLEAERAEDALLNIRQLRGLVEEPALLGMEAYAQEMLGEHEVAGALFARALPGMRKDAGFLNLYIRHLLRARDAEQAAARAAEALESESHNQLSLAYLGVAWRLLDDPREEWLCGYERLVGPVSLRTPAGFSSMSEFLAALVTTLTRLHTAGREPVNQSLRGGSQTSGVLFGRRDPVIAALRDAIEEGVNRRVAALPDDPTHPFLRRKSGRVRFTGSWSVRLWSSGRHVNHFHQEGWVSSAFYVSLPPSVANAAPGDTAGCIQFGEPPTELELPLGPRRVIRPEVGQLVLFPSYIWHGTVPFDDAAPRITVAFDAVPD